MKDMQDGTVARSLTILTLSSEGNGGQGNTVPQPTHFPAEQVSTSMAPSLSLSRRQSSQSSTPPPDDDSSSQGDIIIGFGCLFDSIPLPRASTLVLGSENESGGSTAASPGSSETPEDDGIGELLETPKAQHGWPQGPVAMPTRPILTITPKLDQGIWGSGQLATPTPTRTMSTRSCIVVQPNPSAQLKLFTPDPSPRCAKRPVSPPSAPRPPKRARSQDNIILDDDVFFPHGLKSRKIANARQRGAELNAAGLFQAVSRTPSGDERRTSEGSEYSNDGEY